MTRPWSILLIDLIIVCVVAYGVRKDIRKRTLSKGNAFVTKDACGSNIVRVWPKSEPYDWDKEDCESTNA